MMKMPMFSANDIADMLRPHKTGHAVDPHVVPAQREPVQDFIEMHRLIIGERPHAVTLNDSKDVPLDGR